LFYHTKPAAIMLLIGNVRSIYTNVLVSVI